MTLIALNQIWANYGGRDVLQDVSLQVEERDYLGVVGPNGGGKTTLMKIILGLHKPQKGTVRFYLNGEPTDRLTIGYLPQYNQIDKKFPISVREVILSGLAHEKGFFGRYTKTDRERVQEVVAQLGLEGLEERQIGELSGGQLQRVFLGRAIAAHPQAVILDEPNTYLDREGEERLYELLEHINRESAILLVSHDQEAIARYAKRVVRVCETLTLLPGNDK